jgi:tetratricopeptide (TPR) repeat protein
MTSTRYRLVLVVLVLGTATSPVPAEGGPSARDKALLAKVSQRLLAVCDPVPGFTWPPDFGFEDGGLNAYATIVRKGEKIHPIIRITPEMMKKVIQGDPDRLALILGHELGHILRRHVLANEKRDRTPFLKNTFSRAEETEADLLGVDLMVRAGFSYRKGIKGIQRMTKMGLEYSSFEGLGKDHPSWNDRLTLIDKNQENVWKAMSAFRNGALFLATEQYEAAESCFERVIADFPACYEAHVNLGFACLMRYCDKLDTADLREYGIGQILTGGFYQRVESIKVRGKDRPLWWKAVGALREALRIKPNLTLAKANLGLAYLVHPDAKDVGEATKLMQEAAAAAATDKTLDGVAHSALLINLGIANLAGGDPDKGLAQLDQGEEIGRQVAAARGGRRENPTLTAALLYTRAQRLAARKDGDSKEQAVVLLEKYLKTASPLSLWWPLAYERYAALCKTLERTPKAENAFKKDRVEPIRLVTGVKLKSGVTITLGDALEEVVKKLGSGLQTSCGVSTNLKRVHYGKEGVDLLVTEVVLAISLVGSEAPPLPLRGQGVSGRRAGELRLGMSVKELESLLGDDYRPCELTVTEMYYRFYREQGVAVRLIKGKVVEVVVVQIPER